MTITERLQLYMNIKKLNANNISTDACLPLELIHNAIKSNSGLSSDCIEKILTTYNDLNPEWFIVEQGPVLKTCKHEVHNNGNRNNMNSNICGNVNGNVIISYSEFSHIMEMYKNYHENYRMVSQTLKICQKNLNKSLKQIAVLIELLKSK